MATFVHQDHVKKPTVPETVTGDIGTSKRNILRRGGPGKSRKEGAAASGVDDGSTYVDPSSLDQRDPNYDSEQETGREDIPRLSALLREDVGKSKMTLTAYKKTVEPIITEYFVSGDVDDVLVSIQEIGAPEYSYECVKRAINMSFDKADHERELVSQLLSIGYPDIFSSNMIGKGFERLFEIIDEIEKDAPSARDLLAKFLGRAVVDEVLPPSFLADAVVCNLGGDIIEHTKHMLSREHGRALLDRSWGPGDGRPVEEMKVAIDQGLLEYLTSGDVAEAVRCIRELHAPFFFHEVVKRAVVLSIDKTPEEQQQISNFLFQLYEEDMLSAQQAVKGFRRLYDLIGDLKLDSPHAPEILEGFTKRAIGDAFLPADFQA